MYLQVHVNGSLQAELSVLDDDGIFVLCNPVDRPVKRPIEDDAGGLAVKPGIVLTFEIGGRFCARFGQFASEEAMPFVFIAEYFTMTSTNATVILRDALHNFCSNQTQPHRQPVERARFLPNCRLDATLYYLWFPLCSIGTDLPAADAGALSQDAVTRLVHWRI